MVEEEGCLPTFATVVGEEGCLPTFATAVEEEGGLDLELQLVSDGLHPVLQGLLVEDHHAVGGTCRPAHTHITHPLLFH